MRKGYRSLAEQLQLAEAHWSIAAAAMAYAVEPTPDGLAAIRRTYMALLAGIANER